MARLTWGAGGRAAEEGVEVAARTWDYLWAVPGGYGWGLYG